MHDTLVARIGKQLGATELQLIEGINEEATTIAVATQSRPGRSDQA
jgi:hypothetical protein